MAGGAAATPGTLPASSGPCLPVPRGGDPGGAGDEASRAPVRARASVVGIAERCASGQASARCPESRRVSGERGSPKSAVLGPRRRSGLSARLLTRPGRRCGGVRCRRPGAWSGASPAACGSSPPPPPSHPSCGGARPPRRFCTNKGGLRGASAAPPALRSAPARGGR